MSSTGKPRFWKLLALAGATVLALAPSALAQDECANRGNLDAQFCDADGDLVADASLMKPIPAWPGRCR